MASQNGIDLTPYKQTRFVEGRQKVKLYYISPAYHKAHKGFPPQQTVKNMAFNMPELGEHMIIDEVFAADILGKTKFKDNKPIFMLESEGGAEIAALIKKALEDGTPFDELEIDKVKARSQMAKLDDDDLLALMKQRGYTVEKEEPTESAPTVPTTTKKKAAAPKNTTPKENK